MKTSQPPNAIMPTGVISSPNRKDLPPRDGRSRSRGSTLIRQTPDDTVHHPRVRLQPDASTLRSAANGAYRSRLLARLKPGLIKIRRLSSEVVSRPSRPGASQRSGSLSVTRRIATCPLRRLSYGGRYFRRRRTRLRRGIRTVHYLLSRISSSRLPAPLLRNISRALASDFPANSSVCRSSNGPFCAAHRFWPLLCCRSRVWTG
jgi:hypothetical protein